jgi:hypothetical protein
MTTFSRGFASLILLAGFAFGQEGSFDKGENEVAGYIGVSDGGLTVGGSYGKGYSDKISIHGDFSHVFLGSTNFGAGFGSYSAGLTNINGTVQYHFKDVVGPKFVPYAAGGLGVSRFGYSYTGTILNGGFGDSATRVYLNLGGGARYYVKDDWGIRPELMLFLGSGSYARFSVGIFKQF